MSHDTMRLLLKCKDVRNHVIGKNKENIPLIFLPFRIIAILLVPRALDSRYEVNQQMCIRLASSILFTDARIWKCRTGTHLERGNARYTCEQEPCQKRAGTCNQPRAPREERRPQRPARKQPQSGPQAHFANVTVR